MNTTDLRTMIDQCISLPPDDPRRVRLRQLVAVADGPMQQYYLIAAAEQEKIRLALVKDEPSPPDTLEASLLEIPNLHDPYAGIVRLARPLAAAAIVIILAGAGFGLWFAFSAARDRADQISQLADQQAAQSLAAQCLSIDLNKPPQLTSATDPKALQQTLSNLHMPFPPEILNNMGYHLAGYAVCYVSGQPAILTVWKQGDSQCTMLQFPYSVLTGSLATSSQQIQLQPPDFIAGKPGQMYTVTLWPQTSSGGNCGWAAVMPGTNGYPAGYD